MSKKDGSLSVQYTITWIGLLVGLGFYVADILIDVFVFSEGTLIEQILHPTYHEMWMRTCVLLVAVSFAIYVQILLKREHETRMTLRLWASGGCIPGKYQYLMTRARLFTY